LSHIQATNQAHSLRGAGRPLQIAARRGLLLLVPHVQAQRAHKQKEGKGENKTKILNAN